jgi:hypothetical protein
VDILSAVARHVKRDESVCLSRTANDRVGYQKKTTIATSMIHAAVGMDGVRVGPQISKKSAKAAHSTPTSVRNVFGNDTVHR